MIDGSITLNRSGAFYPLRLQSGRYNSGNELKGPHSCVIWYEMQSAKPRPKPSVSDFWGDWGAGWGISFPSQIDLS